MDRFSLLALVRAHRPFDSREAEMREEILRFVAEEPRCAERSLAVGHLTGSAWIVDASGSRALLMHHRKLDRWLQPGGHADGDLDLARVARREAEEETGLASLRATGPEIFDLDRHRIPERAGEPAHWHYDLRFRFEADPAEPLRLTPEAKALAWVELARLGEYNAEASLQRMARRTLAG